MTSTKFFDSTEELPEASSNPGSSNSSKLWKYKSNGCSDLANTSFSCEKRVLLNQENKKTDSDIIAIPEKERIVDITGTDASNLNSNKKEICETNLNIETTPEIKEFVSNSESSNVPIDTVPCNTTGRDSVVHTYMNNLNDLKTSLHTENSSYSYTASPFKEFVSPEANSYPRQTETNAIKGNATTYSYTPTFQSTTSYLNNSNLSPKINYNEYPINSESTNNYMRSRLNAYPGPTTSSISNNWNTFVDVPYSVPSFTSSPPPAIAETPITEIHTFENSFTKEPFFQNNSFSTNYSMDRKNMNFLNMYSNNATPVGSNTMNSMQNGPFSGAVNMSPRRDYVSEYKNLSNFPGNYKEFKGNAVDNIKHANTYMNMAQRNNSATVMEPVPTFGSTNIPFRSENIAERNDLFRPRTFSTPITKTQTEAEVVENIQSSPDYARATHSSQVVDKKFVHEGFDTIKIPKYRQVEVVEKVVEVPVVHKINKYVDKYEIKQIEKTIKKPINKYIETKIEVPEFHYTDKVVEVPEIHEIVKIVEKPEIKERIIYKNKIETKIIPKYIEVPVVKIVDKYEEYDDIQEVVKTVPVKKVVEIPTEVIKKVKVPIKKIIEQPNYVPVIKYRDVPIEKIRYVPKIETVELMKRVPKIIDVPVPVRVPKVEIIDRPYYINKYVDKYINVPVSKRYTPIYKYQGKKIVEIPIHKPYIVTHDTFVPKSISSKVFNGNRSIYTNPIDINSLSATKQKELFDVVNKNHPDLQRSFSANTLERSHQKPPYNSTAPQNINSTPYIPVVNRNTLSQNSFSNPLHTKSFSFQKYNSNYDINTNADNNLNKSPRNLQFTRSLNTHSSNQIPSFNSFGNINSNFVNTSNPINRLYSNDALPSFPHRTNSMMSNPEHNGSFSKNTINHCNVNNNAPFLPDLSSNIKMHMNNGNSSNTSRNVSYNSNFKNSFSNGNHFMRSRSPSVCSEGISAYAVEHIGQSQGCIDSNLTSESIHNVNGNVGRNYSFIE